MEEATTQSVGRGHKWDEHGGERGGTEGNGLTRDKDGREAGDDDEGRETEEQRKMGGEEEERQKLETEYGAKAGVNGVRER